eukprot:TRINITY_DN29250_c0_g1_i1.p2 TRINITY_DN29250_c0_g1~~TRINITY_DN29250_c0_g1_i1.p2  ORF type:complete len:113 (-),score=4.40 TRINITY_DN29250_c0_g1_i1:13-351(-)
MTLILGCASVRRQALALQLGLFTARSRCLQQARSRVFRSPPLRLSLPVQSRRLSADLQRLSPYCAWLKDSPEVRHKDFSMSLSVCSVVVFSSDSQAVACYAGFGTTPDFTTP